jgi:hypothetical protein
MFDPRRLFGYAWRAVPPGATKNGGPNTVMRTLMPSSCRRRAIASPGQAGQGIAHQ